jgi:hypothetical protein
MQIFFLDNSPTQAAKWLTDKHVVKQILETVQMFCTNYHLQNVDAPYKKTHQNHPSTIWLRESYDNFLWGIEHGYAIAKEYTERYGKRHKCEDVLDWCESNSWRLSFDKQELTPFAIAIAEDTICRQKPNFYAVDAVQKYRMYYQYDKVSIHSWKQNKPDWIQ